MQHIQPAPMGHADNHLTKSNLAATLEDLLKGRDYGFTTIKAKTLGAGVFFVQIALKLGGVDKPLINRLLAAYGKICPIANSFNSFLNPRLLRRILNMHEFDTDGAAIGFAQQGEDFAQRCRFKAKHIINKDRSVPIILTKSVCCRIKLWMNRLFFQRQWVQLGQKMATDTIGTDQHHRAKRVQCRRANIRCLDMSSGNMAFSNGLDG